jgi:hypothetical protein
MYGDFHPMPGRHAPDGFCQSTSQIPISAPLVLLQPCGPKRRGVRLDIDDICFRVG